MTWPTSCKLIKPSRAPRPFPSRCSHSLKTTWISTNLWPTLNTEELVILENVCIFKIFQSSTHKRKKKNSTWSLQWPLITALQGKYSWYYMHFDSMTHNLCSASLDSGWERSWEKELYAAQNCVKISVLACSESIWARQKCEGMPDSKRTLYSTTRKRAVQVYLKQCVSDTAQGHAKILLCSCWLCCF